MEENYFAFITADVLNDEKIRDSEKLLYARIVSLTKKEGYCFATNKYLADISNCSVKTVIRRINNLKKYGYISTKLNYKKSTKEVESRYLFLTNLDKIETTSSQKRDEAHDKIETTPSDKNDTVIYKDFINKDINKLENKEKKLKFQKFNEEEKEFIFKNNIFFDYSFIFAGSTIEFNDFNEFLKMFEI